MEYDPNNETYQDNHMTMEQIMTILDLPRDAITDTPEDSSKEVPKDHQEEFDTQEVITNITDLPRREPKQRLEGFSSYNSETSASPANIVHGVLNFNINKLLDLPGSANK